MKQAEIEKLYKVVIENMSEVVWVGDKNFKTIYVNPKGYDLTGYTKKEVLGKHGYMFWDKENANEIEQVIKKSGIKVTRYLGNIKSKKDGTIPVLLTSTKMKDGNIIAIITDIRELSAKETMYRQLVESMNEAVWMGDDKEKTIYANPKFCDIVGNSLENIIGIKASKFWDKESAARLHKVYKKERRAEMGSSYEGNLINKKGEKIPVLISGAPLYEGGTIQIMTDLRKLKQKEEHEQILSRAIQHANEAIIIFDTDFKITSWNKGARIIFGYRSEEKIGSNVDSILGREEIKQISKDPKTMLRFDFYAKNKNGEEIKVGANLTPVFQNNSNKVSAYLMIIRDITAKSKFEEDRILKYQKTREAYQKFSTIRRQMDYILELLELCSKTKDLTSIADFIVSSIIMLTHVDACVLRTYESKKYTLNLLSSFGVGEDWASKSNIKYKNSLLEKAYKSGMPLKIVDIAKQSRYQSIPLARKKNLSSLLLIPLVFKSKLIGSLSLYTSPDKKLEIFENEFIEKYAHAIEIALASIINCDDYKK